MAAQSSIYLRISWTEEPGVAKSQARLKQLNMHTHNSNNFPGGAVVRILFAHTGESRDMGSIPGLGRSPGVRNGNPLQYSCLENSTDRGAWRVIQSMGSQRKRQLGTGTR